MQLLKNREEALTAKAAARGKEGRRARARGDDVESMGRVQLLGEAFQKIQAATGIKARARSQCWTITFCCARWASGRAHGTGAHTERGSCTSLQAAQCTRASPARVLGPLQPF